MFLMMCDNIARNM